MNKLKLLTAVALTGLLGLSARASIPVDYSSVNIHITVLIQTNETTTATTFKEHVTTVKVTNKDMLAQVAAEFGDTYPAGAQLVIFFGFWDGPFAVLDKNGNVLRANASSNGDSFELSISQSGTRVDTGGGKFSGNSTDVLALPGSFVWVDGTDSNEIQVFGLTHITDTFGSNNDPETFNLSNGVESGFFGGSNTLCFGSVNGHGANSNDL